MTRLKALSGLAAVLLVTACSGDRVGNAPTNYDPIPPMMPAEAPPPVVEAPTVPRIEVRLPGADSTLVRGRLATARRARGYTITVDQPSQLVAEKRLPPDEALKRTNNASSNAAFRLDYIFNTSGGAVTVSLEASIVTNPGAPGEVVRPIAMPGPDAEALKKEISDSQ